jgi:PadR family transcriptional regulator PadR
MAKTNPPFMSGVPELLVLRLLNHRPMYGYELVRTIRLVTGEAITLGEGVVYPVLHSLEESGALRPKRKDVNGRTRVYYSVSAKGRRRLNDLTLEWERIQGGIRSAFSDDAYA